jgi:hypothetical protein
MSAYVPQRPNPAKRSAARIPIALNQKRKPMTPKDLFSVAIGALAVWFICIATVSMLSSATGQEFAYLIVGVLLLAVAGFVARSGPTWK